MTALTASSPEIGSRGIVKAIAWAGIAGAAIDAVYFSSSAILSGHSPVRTLQGIASFWFGSSSSGLGATSAIVGAATHVGLAIIMASGYLVLARRVEFLRNLQFGGGALYGLFLYAIMYFAVMPLRWPSLYPRWDWPRSSLDIAVHVIIGATFAFMLRSPLAFGAGATVRGIDD